MSERIRRFPSGAFRARAVGPVRQSGKGAQQIAKDLELTETCSRGLRMTLGAREPPPGLVHHSDRGLQYASAAHRKALADGGLACRMSRKDNRRDGAVAESSLAAREGDLVDRADFATGAEARAAIFEYVEVFYHRRRRHCHLGDRTPVAFEEEVDGSIREAT
jgi:transposase InsO family protein